MPEATKTWLDVLASYNYAVDLRLFIDRANYPGWFRDRIDGSRDSTSAFEDRFRGLADLNLEVWYEVVFWKMFSQGGRRDPKTRELILKIATAGVSAKNLHRYCVGYIHHPTRASLQEFVELLWGKGGRALAVASVFPAFIAPDQFPMSDTRVAKWARACLALHNAADNHGPQLVVSAYPHNGSTVLTLSDWPFIESWIPWCRHTARKLTSLSGFSWRARDVEMAIFHAWGDRDARKKAGVQKDRPLIDLPPISTI